MNTNEKEFNEKTVAVAMSGGVDSSVVAAMLKKDGYNVIGVTGIMSENFSRCCSPEDVAMAKKVCDQLGVEHKIIDVHEEFKQEIIDYFISEYLTGRTPSPCGLCNSHIKFGIMMRKALSLGADVLATGHYAQIIRDADGVCHLHRGVHKEKDQSYFLFGLTQEQLAVSFLPLGGMTKKEVSAYANEWDLPCRASKESQELCFISEANHGTWIDTRVLQTFPKGDVLDTSGKKVGEHAGIHHYTIGQRRGLGVAAGKPVYVVKLDAEQNIVIVGDRDEVMKKEMKVKDINWTKGVPPSEEFKSVTQIRYNHDARESIVNLAGSNKADVEFSESQFAITPGQIAAFYDGGELIGGGWIEA